MIVEDHPSNKFFSGFSNCLTYQTPEQFSSHLKHALKHDPKPVCAVFPLDSEANTVSCSCIYMI